MSDDVGAKHMAEDPDVTPTPEQSRDERAIGIVRLVVSVVAIVNVVGTAFGWAPLGIDAEELYMVLSGIGAIVANVWAWWKNNNMTEAAQAGQNLTDMIKGGDL